ncbi:hypothetical protein BDN71DRAFT_1495815 [Pleurotus eryngii]|uniref:GmrSD restriction endonucleases N-terminal domain-containing protein n=1 Tax=Pleurotus eryngii TaxID=5323 RepID=A0A9P6A090_PLEER|nr:hypothetical protein BDN71DRAFT_1495815 [Pleurotus eryngii]
MGHGEDFDDSDSELTPIEDSDNEDHARAKILLRTVSSDLPEPRQKRFPTESIFMAKLNKRIDLDPPYQRDIVWTRSQQSYFIHSLMHNYGSGQILFAVDKVLRGNQWVVVKTCIDGKQRLTSIILFMKGELDCKDPKTMESIWYKADPNDPSQRTRKVLDEESRITWNEKQVWCSEYENLSDAQQRELFQRVQEGVPLTWPETLKAIGTPRAQFVNTLKERIFQSAGFHATCPTKWDVDRGLAFQHTACVVYMISMYHNKSPAKDFEPSPKRLEPWLRNEEFSIPTELIEPINTAVDIFMFLATSSEWKKIFFKVKKQFGCREFGSIACFIYHWMDTLTIEQLPKGISKVRGDVGAKRALWKYLRDKKSWETVLGEFPVGTPAKAAIKLLQIAGDSVTASATAPVANLAENTTSAPPAAGATTSRVKRKLDAPSDKVGVAASIPKPTDGESPKKRSRAVVEGRTKKVSASKAATTIEMADAPPITPTDQRPPKRKWNCIETDDEDAPVEDEGEAPPPKHPRTGGEDAIQSPQAGRDTTTIVAESRTPLPSAQKDQAANLSNVLKRQAGRRSGTKSVAATRSKAKAKASTKPELPPAIPRTGRPASLSLMKIPKYSDAPKSLASSPQLPAAHPSPIYLTTSAANSIKPYASQSPLLQGLPSLKASSPARSQPPIAPRHHPLRTISTPSLPSTTRPTSTTPPAPRPTTPLALSSARVSESNAGQSPSMDARMPQVLPSGSDSLVPTAPGRLDRVRRNRDQASANVASATSGLPPGLVHGHSVSPAIVPGSHPPRIPDSVASASAPSPQATTDPRRRAPPPIQIPMSMGKSELSSSSPMSDLLQRMQNTDYFSPSTSPIPHIRRGPTIPQYGDNASLPTPYRPSSAGIMRSEAPTSVPTAQQHMTLNVSQPSPRSQPRDFPAGAGLSMPTPGLDPSILWEQHRSPAHSASSNESDTRNSYSSRPFLVEPGSTQRPTGNTAGLQPARDMKRKPSWERSQGRCH